VAQIGAFLAQVVSNYKRHNGSLSAAALSFTVFVSSGPALLLFVAGLGYLLRSPERAQQLLLSYLHDFAPALPTQHGLTLNRVLEEIVRGREAATAAGLLVLLWSGSTAVSTVEQIVNLAWDTERGRTFVARRLVSAALLVGSGVLLAVSFLATTALEAIKAGKLTSLGVSPLALSWLWTVSSRLLMVGVTATAFLMVYKFLPFRKVPFVAALIGALFATLLWELAKTGFGFYVVRYASYGKIYGPLAGVIAFMIWLNCSSAVLILGAEASALWARRMEAPSRAES